jgi:hypothetical protein
MSTADYKPGDFTELIWREHCQLEGLEVPPVECRLTKEQRAQSGEHFVISTPGPADEPWVVQTARDRFGLALSGGGIRSATFNLGLVQELAQLRVLPEVDYLATVSGGGYTGGFWTAWLHHQRERASGAGAASVFPLSGRGVAPMAAGDPAPDPRDQREAPEIRHLREFSRFLMPRVGVLAAETWAGVVTILGGLLPSLLCAAAVLVLLWYAWLGVSLLFANETGGERFGWFLGLTITVLGALEVGWRRSHQAEPQSRGLPGFLLATAVGCLVAVWVWLHLGYEAGFLLFSHDEVTQYGYRMANFRPAWAWGTAGLMLLLLRVLPSRFIKGTSNNPQLSGVDRAIARIVALAGGWLALALVWAVSAWLVEEFHERLTVGLTGTGAVTTGGLFVLLRKWLAEPASATRGTNLLETLKAQAKRLGPQWAANAAVLLLVVLVGLGVAQLWKAEEVSLSGSNLVAWWLWGGLFASVLVVLLMFWLFDPARIGMHDFYRARIARCYLGAANPDAARLGQDAAENNRYTTERRHDDVTFGELRKFTCNPPPPGAGQGSRHQPLHLVCCAANDLAGDPLATLYRGARSAVVSVNGISVGSEFAPLPDLRLSSALTASAAAFNSQMGRVSMHLGPAVAFLMSALNLRLGLWVPHPRNRHREDPQWPGRFFFRELFGLSRSSDTHHLHLSDGNHFENFGLYELVRRHCRYIIVSDCGQDPKVAFDDLANVFRRVREDFGVEIELDVTPLRPDENGRSRQHAVVGTIHYDGLNGVDKGSILYLKPGLTGDEPPDVTQYQTRNREFPHETTGDQFYDEAQWESYRRLGEHSARMVLRFLDRTEKKRFAFADDLFRQARDNWQAAPDNQQANFLELTQRCVDLEQDLMSNGPLRLRASVFPEIAASGLALSQLPAPSAEEELKAVSYLLRMLQIMEDVWLAADLDRYWSHPLNEGWMNYFQRWASVPSLRRWWPILRPIYSNGFRQFAKTQFQLHVRDDQARDEPPGMGGQLILQPCTLEKLKQGHAWQECCRRQPLPNEALRGRQPFSYDLKLEPDVDGLALRPLQAGFVLVTEGTTPKGKCDACWDDRDFYVPPALMGAGIVARMLDALIRHYDDKKTVKELRVRLFTEPHPAAGPNSGQPSPAGRRLDPAERTERVRRIEFYKSRGFVSPIAQTGDAAAGVLELILQLPRN